MEEELIRLRKFMLKQVFIFLLILAFTIALTPLIFKIVSSGIEAYSFGVIDTINLYFSISFTLSLVIFIPVFIINFLNYVSDALYEHERKIISRYKYFFVLFLIFGFIIGFYASYFSFKIGTAISDILGVKLLQSGKELFFLRIYMGLALGFCFEVFPAMRLLISLNVIKKGDVLKNTKYLIVFFYIISALVSPGDWLFGTLIIFTTLLVVYFLTIYL